MSRPYKFRTSNMFYYSHCIHVLILELEHVKRNRILAVGPPSSCKELSEVGHYLNGLYLITDQKNKQIKTVSCQFKSVGYFKIKFLKTIILGGSKEIYR